MKRLIFWTLAWLLIGGIALGQTTPQVKWDHDGVNVTSFKCVVDGGTPVSLGLPTPSGTTYSSDITNCTGIMVNGTHTLKIQACNASGCADSATITVVKL